MELPLGQLSDGERKELGGRRSFKGASVKDTFKQTPTHSNEVLRHF